MNATRKSPRKHARGMQPHEEANRLDRIRQLIELGLQALEGQDDECARIGRTALRLGMSETMILQDEATLANAILKTHVPTIPKTRAKRMVLV